ncbi:MAG: ATP-dependent nuclease [Bacteroidales bacterium]
MYLSTLKLWNFRKYGIKGDLFESSLPGLEIEFKDGVNVLIGENDSGKTAITDAIRYVLRTQSQESIYIDEKDFFQDVDGRADELRIECTFKGFSDQDAAHFLEWIGFEEIKSADGTDKKESEYVLRVWLYARNKDNSIYQYVKAGLNGDGNYMEGEARNLLRVVYLKPLRDALTEMTHGHKSRLAQILKSHKAFRKTKDATGKEEAHKLEELYKKLKIDIDTHLSSTGDGSELINQINKVLTEQFLLENDERSSKITLTGSDLIDILKQLDLVLEPNKSGLGTLNLLYMAAEMLLLDEMKLGLKLTLIEELEAHLHPQYQLRLIDFINENQQRYGQFILTTHSTTLASKLDIKNLIVCKGNDVYPMGPDETRLNASDYNFLHRFLDATKSNFFFASGVIIVEGDAENLLLPTIAKLIDRPLHKYGVSIVNVGSTAFKRYAKIFLRRDGKTYPHSVSIVSDLDIRSLEYYVDNPIKVKFFDATFKAKLQSITEGIDYGKFPEYFESQKQFEQAIKDNRITKKFPPTAVGVPSILEQLKEIYKSHILEDKPMTSESITSMRIDKKNILESDWQDPVRIFLPNQWTLEYEIASSLLYRHLAIAIECARKEDKDPSFVFNAESIDKIKNDILEIYPNENPTAQESYDIFKLLDKGQISKAATAQYLAFLLEHSKSDIGKVLKTDPALKYLIDAIIHVTKPF